MTDARTAGRGRSPDRRLVVSTRALLTLVMLASNVVGAAVVFVLAAWAVPSTEGEVSTASVLTNLAVGVALLVAGIVVGGAFRAKDLTGSLRWARERRQPTEAEARAVLHGPQRVVTVQAWCWVAATLILAVVNTFFSVRLGLKVGLSVALGGLSTCAITYLLTERILRGLAARVLRDGVPGGSSAPGIATRALLAWTVGTGVPIVALMLTAGAALAFDSVSATRLAVAILALGGVALLAGWVASTLATRAVADPVVALREALARVEGGDYDTSVAVYDASEIGSVQAGFNRMVGGLRERERVKDLFGRQVGEDVARRAVEAEAELGGEMRDVAVLFVDLVGSTGLAASRPPHEVVNVLNDLFAVVVDAVTDHDGWVNKFEGDAALAVFGAPAAVADPARQALAAARGLAARVRAEMPDQAVGIGVAAGPVVAGNVGDRRRFEYTVIGDPVNVAARLCELAKTTDAGLLTTTDTVAAADQGEGRCWEAGDEAMLRGRSTPVRLALPRSGDEVNLRDRC